MTRRPHRNHSPAFEEKVVVAAIKGEKTLIELTEEAFGGLDEAFNNAGTVGDMGAVPEMDLETRPAVIATNLTSAFFAAKARLPVLKKRGGGSTVYTSSFVGFSNGGMPGVGAYSASKAGLIGLTQSLASDHAAEGIRSNALLPGGTIIRQAADTPCRASGAGTGFTEDR